MTLTHLSLFSGIGGIDLAAEWAGFETVGQVEWADYPTKVLEKHWPDVPRWRDIRDVTGEVLPNGITVVSGGFPCQPFSTAGRQKGAEDERYLWPEMLRVIREVRPTWVVGENVKGIVSIALDTVCSELETEGYEVQPFIVPAISVGAPHRRDRVFIVGYAKHDGLHASEITRSFVAAGYYNAERSYQTGELERTGRPRSHENLADSSSIRPSGSRELVESVNSTKTRNGEATQSFNGRISREWAIESRLGGMFNGVSDGLVQHQWPAWQGEDQFEWEPPRVALGIKDRVDRLKCLGNAVVPQQIYPIFKAIADIENGVF